jgi:hypothetical protein
MLAVPSGMLDRENDDLIGLFVERVIDQIGLLPRHQLADTLDPLLPPEARKADEVLE